MGAIVSQDVVETLLQATDVPVRVSQDVIEALLNDSSPVLRVSQHIIEVVIQSKPNITSLTPDTGAIGATITIAGSGFKDAQGNGVVLFNGASGTITSWSDTQIVCTVPTYATTGDLVVIDSYGNLSNAVTMTVTDTPPTVGAGNVGPGDTNVDFYACVRLGQFFIPTTSIQALTVKTKNSRSGQPGTVTFEIYLAAGDGKPTGAVLASGTTNGNSFTTDPTGEWIVVPVTPNVILTAGVIYTLVWYAADGDTSNKGKGKKKASGSYAGGKALTSTDCSATWTVDDPGDHDFEIGGLIYVAPSGSTPAFGGAVMSGGPINLGDLPIRN